MPELEQEEPRRSNPLPKSDIVSKNEFSSREHHSTINQRDLAILRLKGRKEPATPKRGMSHTRGPIGWEPQGMVPHDRAGPPGAIYSSNRDLLEHPPTVPKERRDWKAEKRKRKNTGADGQQASGP